MELTFQNHPDIVIATNTFRNVPTILQFEDTPLIEVVKQVDAGYEINFRIFDRDGRKIGAVNGSRLIRTNEGKNANIKSREEANLTVWELDGEPIIEMRRKGPHALKGWAELYTPEGVFIKATDSEASAILRTGVALPGGWTMENSIFDGCKIGIHVTKDGFGLGYGGGSIYIGSLES